MDDALALEVVDRRYEPLFMERDYLLLDGAASPRPEPRRGSCSSVRWASARSWALPDAAPGCAQVLTLELEYTPAGRLVRLLDSTPELRSACGATTCALQTGRIVPRRCASRVLIDPVISRPATGVRWMLGQAAALPLADGRRAASARPG